VTLLKLNPKIPELADLASGQLLQYLISSNRYQAITLLIAVKAEFGPLIIPLLMDFKRVTIRINRFLYGWIIILKIILLKFWKVENIGNFTQERWQKGIAGGKC